MRDGITQPGSLTAPPTTAEALWTATERLRALEEAAPAGIVALDRHGRVTIWNHTAEQLFGWLASEVIGRPSPLASAHHPCPDATLAGRVLEGEVLSGVETSLLCKDGSSISICQCGGPIRDAAGAVSGSMWVLTDHRGAKRVEQQLLQGQKMEAFGQLAVGIAHDFNNLLTVVIGFSELVLDRVRTQPDVVADVEEIANAGERASQLTRQLLAFSRKQVWVSQVLDLNQVVGHFTSMLSRVIRENIRLSVVPAPSLGRMKADPGQIEQVIMNLVVNARDAMPHGGEITITTANVVVDAALAGQAVGVVTGRYVVLTVCDTGIGMTPDVLARVFEPFFTTKPVGKGTGLGLSTVFALMEQSGGGVTVQSAPGVGTTVATYWPAVDDAVDSVSVSQASSLSLEGTETILLVEDETAVRRLAGRVLERAGYTVLPARDAEDAMTIEGRYPGVIHLLVSDLIMPGLSGPDLAQFLVQRRPRMRALFVSGYASRDVFDRGLSSPTASFLQKPFRPEALARKVRDTLDRQPLAPGPSPGSSAR